MTHGVSLVLPTYSRDSIHCCYRLGHFRAQQEFSSRLSQKRDIDKLQTAMASVVKADATQTGRRQTRVRRSDELELV